jgi:hypothetical protein
MGTHLDSTTRLTIHPDSAHGFLLQHHDRFADDVLGFLG